MGLEFLKAKGGFKIRYYSDITKRIYETEEALIEEETKILEERKAREEKEKKLKTERAGRAKAVEAAFEVAKKANEDANMLLKDFIKDYGSYHYSCSDEKKAPSLFSLFDLF